MPRKSKSKNKSSAVSSGTSFLYDITINGKTYMECDECGTCLNPSSTISHSQSTCNRIFNQLKRIGNPTDVVFIQPQNAFFCIICKRSFAGNTALIAHYEALHTRTNPPPAPSPPQQTILKTRHRQLLAEQARKYEAQITASRQTQSGCNSKISNLTNEIKTLKKSNATHAAKVTQLTKQIKTLKPLSSKIHTLSQENASKAKTIKQLNSKVSQLTQQIHSMEPQRIQSLEQENEKLKSARTKTQRTHQQTLSKLRNKHAEENEGLQKRVKQLEKELGKTRSENSRLIIECENLKREHSEPSRRYQLTKLKKRISELCEDISQELSLKMSDLQSELAESSAAAEHMEPYLQIEQFHQDLELVEKFHRSRMRSEHSLQAQHRNIDALTQMLSEAMDECRKYEEIANQTTARIEDERSGLIEALSSVENCERWGFDRFSTYLMVTHRDLYVKYEHVFETWKSLKGYAVTNLNVALLQISGVHDEDDQAVLMGVVMNLRGENMENEDPQVEGFEVTGCF